MLRACKGVNRFASYRERAGLRSLFSIPGVGFLSVQAVQQRDYPVVQATVVVLTVAVVLMNLLTDIAYTMLDPRVRLDA